MIRPKGAKVIAAVNLDPKTSARILQEAVQAHHQVVLRTPAMRDASVNGYLISVDDRALLLEVTGRPALDFASLIDTSCEVQLFGDQRYIFNATITAAPKWGESRSLAVSRPATIKVLDRRRFARAKLAASSMVTLQWTRRGALHRQSASLLNISVDGLACRIDDAAAAASINGASDLLVSFRLPNHTRSFELRAVVANRTPASAGGVILGLQYDTAAVPTDELDALRRALRNPAVFNQPAELPA